DVVGYMNSDGVFVKLQPGEKPPPGTKAGILGADGVFHASDDGKKRKGSTIEGDFGYINSDGEFVKLEPGQSPPPGVETGVMGLDGKFHAGQDNRRPSQTGKVPGDFGYINKDGKFVKLGPGQNPPAGVKTGVMGPDGEFREGQDNRRPSQIGKVPGDFGYINKDGKFVKLGPGQNPPAGVKTGVMG